LLYLKKDEDGRMKKDGSGSAPILLCIDISCIESDIIEGISFK